VHGFLPGFLGTEEGLYFGMSIALIAYLIIATGIQKRATEWETVTKHSGSRVFDGVTFSTSLALLCGLWDANVLKALGDMKPFLFLAACSGISYSVFALVPRK
jgi:hypothetical protein